MKHTTLLIFTLVFSIISCKNKPTEKNQSTEKSKNYKLVEEDGIYIEKFDSTITDVNKYNKNNIVYNVGNVFKYSYEYISPDGKKYFFKTEGDNWEFVETSDVDSSTVKFVEISVLNGNPLSDHVPDYQQTALKYKFQNNKMYSISGAIENEKNVWIHPPRDDFFRILELNPFPFIKSPYKVGNKWSWSLGIGDHWEDERWKTWDGQIENKYEYEITDKIELNTELGKIECFVVKSTAKSRIGETKLTSYFNPKYGFVKLDYINIDGSKTNLELIEYSE